MGIFPGEICGSTSVRLPSTVPLLRFTVVRVVSGFARDVPLRLATAVLMASPQGLGALTPVPSVDASLFAPMQVFCGREPPCGTLFPRRPTHTTLGIPGTRRP